MKYFLDTKFIEDGKTIDLISIGLVCEDGREYYAINSSCAFHKADKWVKEMTERERLYEESKKYLINKATIKDSILNFLGYTKSGFFPYMFPNDGHLFNFNDNSDYFRLKRRGLVNKPPEFWANYCSYDWVVFCQLFGTMMDLPKGFPMYCNDIQQLWRSKGRPELPKQLNGVHNALECARYAKELYGFLDPSPSLNYPKNTPKKIQLALEEGLELHNENWYKIDFDDLDEVCWLPPDFFSENNPTYIREDLI